MPSFTFTARDPSGRTQNGELVAETTGALVNELRGRGWIVLDVQTATAPSGPSLLARLNPIYWLPPGRVDVEIGFQQIGSMLRSGLTLLSAIQTTGEQARRPSMTRIWERIYE